MTSTKQLIDKFQSQLPACYIQRAFNIETQLRLGTSYLNLGGKKVRSCPKYIRFKLGKGFRLIWHFASDGLQPKAISTRQGFENTLKRIRKSS